MARTATTRSMADAANATSASPAGRPDIQAAADRLARDLTAAYGDATGTRDAGADVAPAAPTVPEIDPNDPALQRDLWETLFQVVAPAVVAAVDAFGKQQRAAGLDAPNTDETVRDIGSFLSDVGGKLWDMLPQVIGTLAQAAATNRDVPGPEDDEGQSRWIFSVLSALAPVVIPAVTDIVNSIAGKREAAPVGATSGVSVLRGETGMTVGRDLFGTIFGGIVQALPTVINVLTGQTGRDVGLTLDSFPTRTYDGDFINLVESDLGDPNSIEFSLSQPYNTWWKQIEVMDGDSVIQAMWVQDGRHDDGPVRLPVTQLRRAGHLRFSKAKFLGIHTAMYEVYDLDKKAGKSLRFEWLDD